MQGQFKFALIALGIMGLMLLLSILILRAAIGRGRGHEGAEAGDGGGRHGGHGGMNSQLSPAEALVLFKSNRASGFEAVKVTLLWLLAQGLLRIGEETTKTFLSSKRIV
jgi:hypothetical protein